MESGALQSFDDVGHQTEGTCQRQEKGQGHPFGAIAIIIGSVGAPWRSAVLMDDLSNQMEDPSGPLSTGEEPTLLFVYGTLKRGQPNHGQLQGARWLGEATLQGAALYDLGPFPMAIAGEGWVGGELYAVAWAALPQLDSFEGCPRLYQRHWLPLADGRQAWAYLGQSHQVRHVKRLPRGYWPPSGPAAESSLLAKAPRQGWVHRSAWGAALLWLLAPRPALAQAFDTLGVCQAWQSSHGAARVELANAIGAAHYLTKERPFQESTPQAPVEIYSPADIQRVCGRS